MRVLKRFLDYAKTGQLEQASPTGALPDSPFEEDVADVVRRLGYAVDHQVGSAGFQIDLGVRHPERPGSYMLAIECDGATYHSALWARERDRLRQDMLENLGWTFHRIWSTDWFHRRELEIERLRLALANSATLRLDGLNIGGANDGYEIDAIDGEVEAENDDAAEEIVIPEAVAVTVPCEMADVTVRAAIEPHEAPLAQLVETVRRIVAVEGPVHEEEIARRVASAFGKERTGNRIVDATRRALRAAAAGDGEDRLQHEGPFWFLPRQGTDVPMRTRSGLRGGVARAEMLPPMEVEAVAKRLLSENGATDHDELVRAVARALGFDRLGPALREVIDGPTRRATDN